jgi:hypothetical protein
MDVNLMSETGKIHVYVVHNHIYSKLETQYLELSNKRIFRAADNKDVLMELKHITETTEMELLVQTYNDHQPGAPGRLINHLRTKKIRTYPSISNTYTELRLSRNELAGLQR